MTIDLLVQKTACCSQFFADSGKYVSNDTVNSWNGIKPFFYATNDDDFV